MSITLGTVAVAAKAAGAHSVTKDAVKKGVGAALAKIVGAATGAVANRIKRWKAVDRYPSEEGSPQRLDIGART